MPTVRRAGTRDVPFLDAQDRHLGLHAVTAAVEQRRVLVAEVDGAPAGFVRWGLLCDEVPFMHLLWVLPDARGRGAGRALVEAWEHAHPPSGSS